MQDAPLATLLADSPVIAAFADDKAAAEEVWESPVYEEVFNDAVTLETLGESSGYASRHATVSHLYTWITADGQEHTGLKAIRTDWRASPGAWYSLQQRVCMPLTVKH